MKNTEVRKTALFDFDEPVKVAIDYYGEPRYYEVTGGELITSTIREDQAYLRGYELTKTGKRRKGATPRGIYIPTETGIMVDGEYQWIATPAAALLKKVRTIGLDLIYPKHVVDV